MRNREPHLDGQIRSRYTLRRLAALLRAGGLPAEVRESSHYEDGRYVRVIADGDFTLERIEIGEFLASATMDTDEQLFDAASRASNVLAGHDIQHRFELYDGQSTLVRYLHHRWPQVSAT
jgi:hypothetical protein